MKGPENKVVNAYSSAAEEYDGEANIGSCWGQVGEAAGASIHPDTRYKVIADIGCGTGPVMERLASELPNDTAFIGVEPSKGMRAQAEKKLTGRSNVQLLDGSFESLPLSDRSVDYLYSILAFHWTTDLEGSVREINRVLKPSGGMDIHFTGRKSGIEFIQVTAPVYRKYLGFRQWMKTAQRRQSFTLDQICEVFGEAFPSGLTVTESFETYYDTLEGHMGWWLRIRGHFDEIEAKDREACDREVDEAISALATEQGIPYTVHMIHVHLAR